MLNLDDFPIEAECPKCSYALEFKILEVRTESQVFCPNCKSSIQLRDKDGSVHIAQDQVQRAMDDLRKAFKRFGK